MEEFEDEEIEFLSEPFLTEEDFVNEACMNELESALRNSPRTYERLFSEDEWNRKKDQWTFKHQIVGAFAQWACRQSPYGVPDGLENVCKYLNKALDSFADWNSMDGMVECSLCEINKWLYDILYEQGITLFDDWNISKNNKEKGEKQKTTFTSAFSKENPDDEFIDLDALLHNICLTIRNERRDNDRFDKEFEEGLKEEND